MNSFGVPAAPPADPSDALHDRRRLAALHEAGLLDTPPEAVFDRLTALATSVLGVPVSFISLIDDERDFYKSHVGLPEPLASDRGAQGRTLCHYTLRSDVPLVLDDVESMPVYRDVPTVQPCGIRAYLGVPMRTGSGENIGSFGALATSSRAR